MENNHDPGPIRINPLLSHCFQTFAIKIRILTRIKLWKYSKGGNFVALMRNPRGIPHLGWPKAGLFS
jgi:hypothetical protein